MLESKENITVRGGIEGGGKGKIEANGNVTARFISNATVSSLQNVIVESGIIQSTVWAGERVIVSGHAAEIIGGEIHADEDVAADTIGSEMGVKTIICLGSRLDELAKLLNEVQDKIAQQENAVEQCTRIIDTMRQQGAQRTGPAPEIEKGLARAREMMATARENLARLTEEQDDLQLQYEDSLSKSRTVRARKNIMPGTVIQILDAELVIRKPTGPATVVKYGNELQVFPYRELSD
ncbi:MAG: FapA family protein [bacterium]